MNNYSYYPNQMQPQFMQGRPTYMDMVQSQQQMNPFMGIKGRPVSSYDEARASMIDFDGSIFYFPDSANSRIYTKQINLDGTSTLKVYVLADSPSLPPQDSIGNKGNVSYEEFDKTVKTLLEEIQKMKGAQSNVQSTAVNEPNAIKQF